MTTDLILIANGSEARLLVHTGTELVVLQTLLRSENPLPQATPRPQESAAEPHGLRRGARVPVDPVRRRMRAFAGIVARRFEQAAAEQPFTRLALFAACPFLSELMRQLSPGLKRSLRAIVDADISELPLAEAQARIEQELDGPSAAGDDEAPASDPSPGSQPATTASSLAV